MMRLGLLLLAAPLLGAQLTGCSSPPPQQGWEYTGGPEAQNVTTLHVHPENPDVLTAGMSSGYIARSTDRGRTWSTLAQTDAGSIRMLDQNRDDGAFFCLGERGAARSTDGGRSWSRVTVNPSAADDVPTAYASNPWSSDVHLAALERDGILRSTDRGVTWTPSVMPPDTIPPIVRAIAFDRTVSDRVFAVIEQRGLVESTDGGMRWRPVGTPDPNAPIAGGQILVPHALNRGWMLASTASGTIVRTTDGGTRWIQVRKGEGAATVLTLAGDPDNPDLVYAGTEGGALVSTDFGVVWRSVSPALPSIASGVTVAPEPTGTSVYVYGEGVGLQRWSPGSAIPERVDTDLGGSTVPAIATSRDGRQIYCIVSTTVHRYDSASARWTPASDGLSGYPLRTLAVDGKTGATVVTSAGDGLYRSTNGGRSWSPVTRNLRAIPASVFETHPVITTRLYASGKQGLFVSMNNGASWVQAKPFTRTFFLTALTPSPSNAALLYGAADDLGVIRSSDAGFTWEVIAQGVPTTGLVAITLDAADGKVAYAWTADGGGYRTTNGGALWTAYTPPWPRGTRALIAVDRFAPSRVAALVNSQLLYTSANAGGTWVLAPAPELGEEAVSLHYNSGAGMVYVGTQFAGVFRTRVIPPSSPPEAD